MLIAGGVFWIMFGILYVWYQALKADPENTIAGTIFGLIVVSAVIGFFFIFNWLIGLNVWVGMVFGIIGIGALIAFALHCAAEKERKKQATLDRHYEILDIVNQEEYTDEELWEYSKSWRVHSPNGWKLSIDGFEKCKPMIEDDYRKYVRYCKVMEDKMFEDKTDITQE